MNNEEYDMKNLRVLPYIGKKRAKRLRDKGFDSIDKIAKASVDDLKNILQGLTESQIEKIIETAKEIAHIESEETKMVVEKEESEKEKEEKEKGEEVKTTEEKEIEKKEKVEEIPEEEKEKIKLAQWLFGGEYTEFIKEKVKREEKEEEEKKKEEQKKPEKKVEKKKEEKKISKKYSIKIKGFVNGYINGYAGVVNGNGVVYGIHKTSRSRIGIILPILIATFVILPVILLSVQGGGYILIDGNFNDWENIKYYSYEPFGMRSVVVNDGTYLYLRVNSLFSTYSSLVIFLDDGSGEFKVSDNFKAGYMVRIDGKGTQIYKSGFYKIYGNISMENAKVMRYAFKGDEMELYISHSFQHYCILYIDFENKILYSSPIITVGKGFAYFEIKTLNMISINKEQKFAVLKTNLGGIQNYSLTLSISPSNEISYWYAIHNGKKLNFSGKTAMLNVENKNDSYEIYARIREDATPSQILRISLTAPTTDIIPTVVDKTSGIYIKSPPKNIKIDGAFGDWSYVIGDANDNMLDKSADIAGYSIVGNNSSSYYYLKFFSGIFLGIPVAISPVDSDGDTVPDYIDPFPTDFNNDGIPDSSTDHDVDGDGIKDYPYGNDMYLNTTIPSNFPDGYAGKKVSIPLGNVKKSRRESEEKITIYVDSDGNEATGFRYSGIGADYRIVLSGKYGEVMRASIDRWNGEWIYFAEAPFAKGYEQIEISSRIGITNTSRIIIETIGWTGEEDSVSKLVFKAPSQPHVIYGYVYDEYGNPLAGATVVITDATTGESATVTTDSTGYYQFDLANLPSGYSDGDLIYINATNTSSGNNGTNSTTVDTSVVSQQVDVYISEFNFIPLTIPALIIIVIIRKK